MKEYYDIHFEQPVKHGDIIKLTDQTVNGQDTFIIFTKPGLSAKFHKTNKDYPYCVSSLLEPCKYSGIPEFEIIGNIYNVFNLIYNE